MENNSTPETSKEALEKQIKSSIEREDEKILKKSIAKVVKNPLFASSVKPTSKKETAQINIMDHKDLTQSKNSNDSDKKEIKPPEPREEKNNQRKIELIQEKKEEPEKEEEVRPKKKTVKDLFSNVQVSVPEEKKQDQQKKHDSVILKKEERSEKTEKPPSQIKESVFKNVSYFISQKKNESQDPQQQISIKITDSSHIGTTLHKNIIFTIEGRDMHGSFSLKRKYTEFKALRKILKQRWPGCFIPGLTSKSDIKKHDDRESDIRLTLQNFLVGLSYSPLMYYKQEIQLFLRSPDIEIEEMSQKMPALKMKDVISRFNSYFGQAFFEGKPNDSIKTFTVSLRKVLAALPTMLSRSLQICQLYDNFAAGMSRFVDFSKSYQKQMILFYSNNKLEDTLICKDTSKLIEKLHDFSFFGNPFYELYSFLSCEARDSQAFLEVIIASELFSLKKDELEVEIKQLQKQVEEIALGHKTLKTVTTRKSKEEVKTELQTKIINLQEDKESALALYSMTSILLHKLSIHTYKTFKRNRYHKVLNQWSKHATKLVPEIQALWSVFEDQLKTLLK